MKKTEQEQAREFAVTLPVIFGVFALIMVAPRYVSWFGWEPKPNAVLPLLIAGPVVCLFSLVFSGLWLRFFRLWMKFALVLSWFMTRVILSVFYFVVLTPVGLVMRVLGKAPLDMEWKDGKTSYWIDKEQREVSLDVSRKQF